MASLRLANVVYAGEPLIAIEHLGELFSVRKLEECFALEWSPTHFTDRANEYRQRVFSLGMAGLIELAESLGDLPGPRQAVLDRTLCLYRPPTVDSPALAEFSVLAEDEVPRFRWGNSRCLRGHEAPLPISDDEPSPQLSVQVGAILIDELDHATEEQSDRAIGGFTLLSLWSYPSRNRVSPGWGSFRLGQLGPVLVANQAQDPSRWTVSIRVNGQTVVQASSKPWRTSFPQMVALASEAAALAPGDIIASGPLARTSSDGRRSLRAGDRIEAEVAGLGVLSGVIVPSNHKSRFLSQAMGEGDKAKTLPPRGAS